MNNRLLGTLPMTPDTPGIEGIDFQKNRDFGDALVADIIAIRKEPRVDKEALKRLSKTISKYTGITTLITPTSSINAWVHPALLDKDHVFYDQYKEWLGAKGAARELESDARPLLKKNEIIRGGVDLRNAKVTGDFAKILIKMSYGSIFFKPNSPFAPGHVAGIILHEVGHAFHLFEFLVRMSTTNYIMEEMAQRLTRTRSRDIRVAILKEAKAAGYDLSTEELVDAKSADLIRLIILRDAFEESKHELGENIYDIRGFEMLADQFAVRMGYGAELSMGLAALYKEFGINVSGSALPMALVGWTIELLFNYFTFGIPFLLSVIFLQPDTTYDSTRKRSDVILMQMRQKLKEEMEPEDRRALLRTLASLEVTWEKYKDYQSLAMMVWAVVPWGRSKATSMRIQQELEKLGNNRMAEAASYIEMGTKA